MVLTCWLYPPWFISHKYHNKLWPVYNLLEDGRNVWSVSLFTLKIWRGGYKQIKLRLQVIVKRLVSVWWGRFSSYWWKRGQASLDTETTCKWKHTMGIYKHSSVVLFGHQGAIDKIQTSHLGGIDGLVYGMIENR